jgi:spindle assembly abnormal protein 6
MELTDEQDPLFLYTLACSEQDFHILKAEQQLLVDFQAFPQSFVELLNFCSSQ